MITLYTFGPYFDLPDGSPFVTKAMLLLKIAGLPYREDRGGYGKAPKGKLPYIEDEGVLVADSTFIRRHVEAKYGFDFDAGLEPEQKATAWAVERLCEDHLYWAMIDARWLDGDNFNKGPARFFDQVPALIRPFVRKIIRARMASRLKAQGLGLHDRAAIRALAKTDIDAIATLLGGKPFMLGDTPSGVDATVFAFVASVMAPTFETPIRGVAEGHTNLVAYRDRIKARYFSAA